MLVNAFRNNFIATMYDVISTAEKFLIHIYSDDTMICAKILSASADNDRDYLYKSLEEVEKFICKLKNELKTI